MFEWDDLRCLLAVHRGGTFAAAAEALRVTPTTVGRRLSALQDALGTTLLIRRGRGYVLSDAGLRLLDHAEAMENAALAVERRVSGEDDRLEGRVRISATEMIATRFIGPQLHRFGAKYPEIALELHIGSELLDLDRRETDIALRLARPTGDHLVIRKMLEVELALYVGRRYIERFGMPCMDQPFAHHRLLGFAEVRAFRRENEWLAETMPDAPVVFRATSVSTVHAAASGGMGIALLPRLSADIDPYLEEVAPAVGLKKREIWLLIHRDLRHAARIRAVVEFLAEVLRDPTLS